MLPRSAVQPGLTSWQACCEHQSLICVCCPPMSAACSPWQHVHQSPLRMSGVYWHCHSLCQHALQDLHSLASPAQGPTSGLAVPARHRPHRYIALLVLQVSPNCRKHAQGGSRHSWRPVACQPPGAWAAGRLWTATCTTCRQGQPSLGQGEAQARRRLCSWMRRSAGRAA